MIYPEYCYVGFKHNLTDKLIPIHINEVKEKESRDKENYQTIYRFKKEILQYDSIRDLDNKVLFYSDWLVIDIDRDKTEDAVFDTERFTTFLDSKVIRYQLWFSGNKGFHVLIPTDSFHFEPTNNQDILKNMALALSHESKVTIDTKIYNYNRILRMPYSLNIKSGKRKVPCELGGGIFKEIDESEMIIDCFCVYLESLYEKIKKMLDKPSSYSVNNDKGICKIFRDINSGDRNNAAYVTAKMLQERRFELDDAMVLLNFWNNQYVNPPLPPEELKRTLSSAYRTPSKSILQSPTMEYDCYTPDKSVNRILKLYKDFDKNVIKTGYKFFDCYTMGLMPGDLIFWLAVNGNLKTCILSNLMYNISKITGKYTLIFSMDMSSDSLQMRHMQMTEKLTLKEVYTRIKTGYDFPIFQKECGKVLVVDTKSPSIDDVARFIDWSLTNYGTLGAIGFDYLGAFKGADNDTKVTSDTVHGLSNLAGKIGICPIFCLVQARREYEGKGGNVEIDKTAGKDTSAIEHKADFIMGSWWHEDENAKRTYYGRFLKNRKYDSEWYEDNSYFKMDFNKKNMILNDMLLELNTPTFQQKKSYNQ